jgi:hypothetical protein
MGETINSFKIGSRSSDRYYGLTPEHYRPCSKDTASPVDSNQRTRVIQSNPPWKYYFETEQYATHSTRKFPAYGNKYKLLICSKSCKTAKDYRLYFLGDEENEESRPSRGKPSSRMNEACAARMFVTLFGNATVSVRYIKQHTGHDPTDTIELRHLRFSAATRRKIMMQLLSRVDEKFISFCHSQVLFRHRLLRR